MVVDPEKPIPQKDEKGRFVTGNIGGGRPKGARAKLGEAFLEAMRASFESRGQDAIDRVIDEKPDQFLKVIAALMPKEIDLGEETAQAMVEVLFRKANAN